MLLKQEGLLHKGPEFCQAFKFVIKLQISTLLQQLAESGEESVVLTANVLDGTADHLGSHRGAGFLEDHIQLQKQFLSYCTDTRRLYTEDESVPPTVSFPHNNLLSPSQTCQASPNIYHKAGGSMRPRYERESSTSDSVFSPNRRKSSASSKSLEEDVSMFSGQDYADPSRSYSESSTTWSEASTTLTTDQCDKSMKSPYTSRSPTSRSVEPGDKSKSTSKSPMSENVESMKQITLSSPSEFQYKKHLPSATTSPRITPPMQMTATPSKGSGAGSGSGTGSCSSANDSINYPIKSNASGTPSVSSPEGDHADASPVNLVNTSSGRSSTAPNSGGITAGEAGMMSTMLYTTPFSNYADYGSKPSILGPEGESSTIYKIKYEGEEYESRYKVPYGPTESGISHAEVYSGIESRDYVTESGELFRIHKKAETKMYHRHTGGRKQPKSCIERRYSETQGNQGYDTGLGLSSSGVGLVASGVGLGSPYGQIKDRDHALSESEVMKMPEMVMHPDLPKSLEEAVKVQQHIFHSSLGLFSPLQRPFLSPARPHSSRERSQSLSDFHALTSPEGLAAGRSRFPSSSFAENLDTPLIIDDEGRIEHRGTEEGLDLSNKKRKMSMDEVYLQASDEHKDTSTSSIPTSQSDETDYDRMSLSQGAVPREDQSTKKYGKGNFIKVATGYQCRICCRVIRHMNNTTAHMRIHANIKPYKCQVCNQQFKYEVDRRYHFSKNHVDLFSKMYFPDEKKTG